MIFSTASTTAKSWYHALTALIVSACFLCGCAPRPPKTHTPAPSLTGAGHSADRIYNDATNAKAGITRAMTEGEKIDYKIMKLREGLR